MAANPFAAFDSQEGAKNSFVRFDQPEPPKAFGSDARNALMQGVQKVPGALPGSADIPAAAAGLDQPFSRTTDRLDRLPTVPMG